METFLMVLGILGIGILSIFTWIKKIIFKPNIQFHKILQSFPLISEHRINEGTKITHDDFINIQISKELTEFIECKRSDIDVFLTKIEKFDTTKLFFKKKKITLFINNIKGLLITKSVNITIESILYLKTNKFNTEIKGEPFEWTALNYISVDKIMKDKNNIDELFVCKFLKF